MSKSNNLNASVNELVKGVAYALFTLTIAIIAVSVAVGLLYGAGYGFALFGACMLAISLWQVVGAVKSAKLRKRMGVATDAEYLNQIMAADTNNPPEIKVIRNE